MVKLVGPDAGTYRFITDQLGSVRMVVNVATGAVVQQIRYDAWGNPTLEHGTWSFQPFAFAGGLHDPATGLIRFGARDYDPHTSRWTAKDPIPFGGLDVNLYAYVRGDPINLIDSRGDSPLDIEICPSLDEDGCCVELKACVEECVRVYRECQNGKIIPPKRKTCKDLMNECFETCNLNWCGGGIASEDEDTCEP
jgi:RHS repeat-associated protein